MSKAVLLFPGRSRWVVLAVAAVLSTLAFPVFAVEPAGDDAASRKEVEAATQEYTRLLKSGPPEASAALFAADGELLEPGMAALRGPEAIKAFLAPLFKAYEVQSAATEIEAVEVHGKAAYVWGTYTQRAGERGKDAAEYHGRIVIAWHKEGDGHWRITRLMVQPFPK